jgi:hypothetical protein
VTLLKELSRGPQPGRALVKKLWPSAASFHMHLPDLLLSDGLVSSDQEGLLSLTPEGKDALERRTWLCAYCTGEFFGARASRRLSEMTCKSCEKVHVVCKACRRFLVVVGGEFPAYHMMLRQCVTPMLRADLLVKMAKPKKTEHGNIL